MNKKNPGQPLSALRYAIIAMAGLVFAIGFTVFYVYQVPKRVASPAQNQIFYLLLLPWALSSAAFLFGAMRSYARFSYKRLGNFLELGGPVVLFCLVLVGGFKLVPPPPEVFDLAVRAYSENMPLITAGQITLKIPGLPHANIGPDGEANFKGISANFRGLPIEVLAQVDGYEEEWTTPSVEDNVLTVKLEKAHPIFVQTATLDPPPPQGKDVQIRVEGQKVDASFDELGGFKFSVNGRAGDHVLLEVFVDRNLVSSKHYILEPGQINVRWTSSSKTR